MLIDAILFSDELDLLEFRLRYLWEHVDLFVVAESPLTFAGTSKRLFLAENQERFKFADEKLFHCEYQLDPAAPRFNNEALARECLRSACLGIDPDGVVLLCDVDEIPTTRQVAAASSVEQAFALPMRTYFRRANWRVQYDRPCRSAHVIPLSTERTPFHDFRREPRRLLPGEWGCHFSYLSFTHEHLERKYSAFSHEELDAPEMSSSALLRLADDYAVDHLGRTTWRGLGILAYEPPHAWNDVQAALYLTLPSSFEQCAPRHGFTRRRIAATLVNLVVVERDSMAGSWVEKSGGALPEISNWRIWVRLSYFAMRDAAARFFFALGGLRRRLARALNSRD